MAWLVNLLVGLGRIVWLAIPIVAGFIVFGIVYNIVSLMVVGAFLSDVMVMMFAGFCGAIVGNFLTGIFWR